MLRLTRIGLGCIAIAAGIAAGSTSGCKNDDGGAPIRRDRVAGDIADVVCGAYQSCDCETGLTDPKDCSDAVTPAIADAISKGELLGLRYYSQCLGKLEDYISAIECKKTSEFEDDEDVAKLLDAVARCKLLAGDGEAGDVCVTAGAVGLASVGDTCGPSLRCKDVCIELPRRQGDLCANIIDCPTGLACLDPNGDGVATCEKPGDKGDKCNPHDAAGCDNDLTCDPDKGKCASLPGIGDACPLGVCDSKSSCDGTTCQPYPKAGDDCTGICGPDLLCDANTGKCTALPEAGEECSVIGCAKGFVCDTTDNTCVATPPAACGLPEALGFCIYRNDGICDDKSGTGLCADGSDPEDCGDTKLCMSVSDGICDEPPPKGTGLCPEGTDPIDCAGADSGGGDCPTANDGVCDEPGGAGTGLCPVGSDPDDCAAGSGSGG